MKKLVFFGGFLTGIVFIIVVIVVFAFATEQPKTAIPGAAIFDEPTEQVFSERSFKVTKVVKDYAALVNGGSIYSSGTMYLLLNHKNHFYYDDEIINVPAGKTVRQIGIYRYITNSNTEKTVPVIEILDY